MAFVGVMRISSGSYRTAMMQILFQILRNWWGKDRVRIAPAVGRVASLRRGQRFVVNNRLFEVLEQSVDVGATGTSLRLLLSEIGSHRSSSGEIRFCISDSCRAGDDVLLKSDSGDLLIREHYIVCIR